MNIDVLNLTEELLAQFKTFLTDYNGEDSSAITEFGKWLKESEDSDKVDDHGEKLIELVTGMQLITISNVVRSRLNKFVNSSPFATFMDYQFLFVLKEHGEMTKSELISSNSMEMSTGIEVIKRLIKNNWISEHDNLKDKRSKIINITIEGEQLAVKNRADADQLYSSFCSELDSSTKKQAYYITNKIVSYNTK